MKLAPEINRNRQIEIAMSASSGDNLAVEIKPDVDEDSQETITVTNTETAETIDVNLPRRQCTSRSSSTSTTMTIRSLASTSEDVGSDDTDDDNDSTTSSTTTSSTTTSTTNDAPGVFPVHVVTGRGSTPGIDPENCDSHNKPELFPPKGRVYRSEVWQHFGFKKRNEELIGRPICKLCFMEVSVKGGSTTNLSKHLKRHHGLSVSQKRTLDDKDDGGDDELIIKGSKLTLEKTEEDRDSNSGRSSTSGSVAPNKNKKITNFFKPPAKLTKSTCANIDRAVGLFVAADLRPLNVVEGYGFRNLVCQLQPAYTPPSRWVLTNKIIPPLYDETSEKVRKSLSETSFCSITTDAWTSRTADGYVTVTVHYLDRHWNMQSFVLHTKPLYEAHTGVNYGKLLLEVLDDWDIVDKTVAVVTDNAANMTIAARAAGIAIHIGCFAHTLNLAVQKSLQIPEVHLLLEKVRKVVGFFHRSNLVNLAFKQNQTSLKLPDHKLIMDTCTRWNSAHDMLERIVEQKKAVLVTLADDKVKKNKEITLEDSDFSRAKKIVSILATAKSVTQMMSSEKVTTLSMIRPLLVKLKTFDTSELDESEEDEYSEMELAMQGTLAKDLGKRYPDAKVKETLNLASFLDPRFKSLRFLTQTEADEICQQATDLLMEMFEDDQTQHQDAVGARPDAGQNQNASTSGGGDDGPLTLVESVFSFCQEVDPQNDEVGRNETAEVKARKEIAGYKAKDNLSLAKDPCQWWKENEKYFPKVAELAKRYLCIPATSVPSERIFSTAGDIISAQRSRLTPSNAHKLIFLKGNISLLK